MDIDHNKESSYHLFYNFLKSDDRNFYEHVYNIFIINFKWQVVTNYY